MISAKTVEENNGMGKTRDLFKKIRDTKGTFHAKRGSIQDRNGMDADVIIPQGGHNNAAINMLMKFIKQELKEKK